MITISGTPGTGKTSVTKYLEDKGYDVIYLNNYLKKHNYGKEISESEIKKIKFPDAIIEGHLSHFIESDFCFVLRTDPVKLEKRLEKRKWSLKKIKENIQSEILDVILIEAMENNKKIIEIETTDKSTEQVSKIIEKIIKTKKIPKKYQPGQIKWLEKYFERYF